jgi:hypothetical protein
MILKFDFINDKMRLTHTNYTTQGTCIEVDYKFAIKRTRSSYTYSSGTYIPYLDKEYTPIFLNIIVQKDNEEIYNDNLDYYENLYFSDYNNGDTIDIAKFIKVTMNDAIQCIIL